MVVFREINLLLCYPHGQAPELEGTFRWFVGMPLAQCGVLVPAEGLGISRPRMAAQLPSNQRADTYCGWTKSTSSQLQVVCQPVLIGLPMSWISSIHSHFAQQP